MTRAFFIAGGSLAFLVGVVCAALGPEIGLACLVAILMLGAVSAIVIDEYEDRRAKEIPWKE